MSGNYHPSISMTILLLLVYNSQAASAVVSQNSVALTIYSSGFAMVKDVRNIYFEQGQSDLDFTDISSNIQSETVTIKPLENQNATKIFQQSFLNGRLSWRVWSDIVKVSPCQIVYKINGISWSVDYTLILGQNETKANFGAWVMINNNARKRFQNAKIKLIGQLGDSQTYSISRLINMTQSGRMQVQFIPKIQNIEVKKVYKVTINSAKQNQENLKTKNTIQIVNQKKNKLGMSIPDGIIRMYKEDMIDNSVEFIGENRISYIAPGQTLKIQTGIVDDIVAKKVIKQFKTLDDKGSYDAIVSMKISNRKLIDSQVIVILNNPFGDNVSIRPRTEALPIKISSVQYRWTRTLPAGKQWQFEWRQSYTVPKSQQTKKNP